MANVHVRSKGHKKYGEPITARIFFLQFFEKKDRKGNWIVCRRAQAGFREADTRRMFEKATGYAVLYSFDNKVYKALDTRGDDRLLFRWKNANPGKIASPEGGKY